MKVKIEIPGIPKINAPTQYTRKGKPYTPEAEAENERGLRASVINRLPFDFKPLSGSISITRALFLFPPNCSFNEKEKNLIKQGAEIEKNLKPDLIDCLKSIIKAMAGIVFTNESQICRIIELKKCYSSSPGIKLEIEEI